MWQIVHKVHKHKIMCTDTDSQNKISIDYNFISCDTNNTVANAVEISGHYVNILTVAEFS